jgi:hypothetical protein
MSPKRYHEAPLVKKVPVSIIALPGGEAESTALRGVLEYFGYRVDMHLIGSRKEFIEILKGSIRTEQLIVLCCHGDNDGIVMGDEKPVTPLDISQSIGLNSKSILNLGCSTGSKEFIDAFRKNAKCEAYIAPTGYPFGNTALLFAVHTLYACIQHKKKLKDSVKASRRFDKESAMFNIW